MKPHKLSHIDCANISRVEASIASFYSVIQNVSKFNLGDYLIGYQVNYNGERMNLLTNSYGVPKKFKVVHIDRFNTPYMKEINKAGNTTGDIISPIAFSGGSIYTNIEFQLDPSYEDSILFQDDQEFNASSLLREKSDLFKEIATYNKSIKINTANSQKLLEFLRTIKVGDILWKSTKSYLTIKKLDPLPLTHNNTRLNNDVVFAIATSIKGEEVELSGRYFRHNRALYSAKPRSYNELKDPNL